ncbi:hypothetical protein GCM10027422_05290 [Hymenobacter arcticus]
MVAMAYLMARYVEPHSRYTAAKAAMSRNREGLAIMGISIKQVVIASAARQSHPNDERTTGVGVVRVRLLRRLAMTDAPYSTFSVPRARRP